MKDILVHRKHNKKFYYDEERATTKCGRERCATCNYIKEDNGFYDIEGKFFSTNHKIDCLTSNVIYGIYCDLCSRIVYVGETGNTIYTRHQLNLSRIRTGRNTDPVVMHFRKKPHNIRHYNIVGIERLFNTEDYRKNRE